MVQDSTHGERLTCSIEISVCPLEMVRFAKRNRRTGSPIAASRRTAPITTKASCLVWKDPRASKSVVASAAGGLARKTNVTNEVIAAAITQAHTRADFSCPAASTFGAFHA